MLLNRTAAAVFSALVCSAALAQGPTFVPKTFSQIPQAATPPASTDTVVGVTSGPADVRWTIAQIQASVGGSCVTPFGYIPTAQWAAIAARTSTYDATANLNAMFAAAANGCVSFQPGLYNVSTAALNVPSNIVIYGNDAELLVPSAGWLLVPHTGYGVLNIYNGSNVWVHDLHIRGTTLAADTNHNPKLIYLELASNVHISHNWLENSSCEGIWDGVALTSNDVFVEGNYFNNVAVSCFGFGGLPAVQANWNGGDVSGNSFVNVGVAVGPSAAMPIIGNYINGCSNVCIGTGDGPTTAGAVVSNNTIQITDANPASACILLGNGTSSQTETGNICIVTETHSNFVNALRNESTNSTVSNETCIVNSSGATSGPILGCFQFLAGGAGQNLVGTYSNINCFYTVTGALRPICFQAAPNNAATLNITVSGGSSVGAAANGGTAWDADVQSGGTVNATLSNVIKDGGLVLLDAPSSHGVELVIATGSNNNTAYSYDNRSGTPQQTTTSFGSSSTGAATQTFTNSPCTGHTTEQWVPITIAGQSGTWFVPACQ